MYHREFAGSTLRSYSNTIRKKSSTFHTELLNIGLVGRRVLLVGGRIGIRFATFGYVWIKFITQE